MPVNQFDNLAIGTRLGLPGLLLLSLAACETVPAGEAPYEPSASMGMIIANDNCQSCHETGRTGESSNSAAPPFREIVNRPGMTQEALAVWLKDGHDYPAEMGFTLEPHRVDSLVEYMMRLRDDAGSDGE